MPVTTGRQKQRKRFCYPRVRHTERAGPSPTCSVSVPDLHGAVARGRGDGGGRHWAPGKKDARGRGLEMPFVLAHWVPCLPQVPQLQGNGQRLELRLRYRHLPTRSCFTKKGRWVWIKSSSPILQVQRLLPLSPAHGHSPGEPQTLKDFHHRCLFKRAPTPVRADGVRPCGQITPLQPAPALSPALPAMGRSPPLGAHTQG